MVLKRPMRVLAGVVALLAWSSVRAAEPAAGRTRAGRKPNHLAGQMSPYLLQHLYNPIDWYPWGDEALQKAKKEDPPIFLSIGYSACHWGHVMEREAFSDPEVARVLNERFVSIKVDREERPDLDDLYMTAVVATTGRGSTWSCARSTPWRVGGCTISSPVDSTVTRPTTSGWCRISKRCWMTTPSSRRSTWRPGRRRDERIFAGSARRRWRGPSAR